MTLRKNNGYQNLGFKNRVLNYAIVLWFVLIGLFGVFSNDLPYPPLAPCLSCPQPDSNGNFTEQGRIEFLERTKDSFDYWSAPDIALLNNNPQADLILYGKDLIAHTSDYYGKNGKIFKAYTNGMSCQNCHLEAGTKVFGNNFAAVASTYPKYRARFGSIENIYERVNDCFERSLNGKKMDTASKEMKAIFAYISWLGKGVKKNTKPAGYGMKDVPFLERAADPGKGKIVYTQKCERCHKSNGEGGMNEEQTAYTYPPLWGANSYNSGAGLFRLSNFAKLVKYNMPFGVDHKTTQLSDEEAWDVAAFVNSQPRPQMNIKADWPNIAEKPFDHPFGPYTDGFSEQQHKYGPFQVIKDKQIKLAKK
ncbi:MAG TPA: c-type cytochrome [Bacteroidia bacterium]